MAFFENARRKAAVGIAKFIGGSLGVNPVMVPWASPEEITDAELVEWYRGWVYKCVFSIAQDVAAIEFVLRKRTSDGFEEIKEHDLLEVLKRPNPDYSGYDFFELLMTYILLTGEAFIYEAVGEITRQPKELYLVRPDRVKVVPDKDSGVIIGYTFRRPDGTEVPFDKDEITHIKLPNPGNPYRGKSPLKAGEDDIQSSDAAAKYLKNQIHNGGRIGGIVNFKGTISKEEFDRVVAKWKTEFAGVDNVGKTQFVRADEVGYQKVGSTVEELDLSTIKNSSRDDILSLYRVPKPILGILDGSIIRANVEGAFYIFAAKVVDPYQKRIANALAPLAARFGEDLELLHRSQVPEDREALVSEVKQLTPSVYSRNEAREKIGAEGRLSEGGDTVSGPVNEMPIGEVETKTASIRVTTRKTKKKKTVKKKVKKTFDFTYEQKEAFRKGLYLRQSGWEAKAVDQIRKHLKPQEAAVIEAVTEKYKKLDPKKKAYDDVLFETAKEAAKLSAAVVPVVAELFDEQGENALKFIGSEAAFVVTEEVSATIRRRVDRLAAEYTEKTRRSLERAITEAVAGEESVTKLGSRIGKIYKSARGYRATRIARTETIKASNFATLEAYKQSGVVSEKKWFANNGACEFCRSFHNLSTGLAMNYAKTGTEVVGEDGGKLTVGYEDIDTPPLHPNCRCTIIPVSK